MNDEIAYVGVVDSVLRLPGDISAGIIRKDADDVDLVEVLKFATAEFGEFAARNEMQQLFFLVVSSAVMSRSLVDAPRRPTYWGQAEF